MDISSGSKFQLEDDMDKFKDDIDDKGKEECQAWLEFLAIHMARAKSKVCAHAVTTLATIFHALPRLGLIYPLLLNKLRYALTLFPRSFSMLSPLNSVYLLVTCLGGEPWDHHCWSVHAYCPPTFCHPILACGSDFY